MVRRWSWASVGVAASWLIAVATVALWELQTAPPFSLRGGQAGLPYLWTTLAFVVGGPAALLASLGCVVLAVVARLRSSASVGRLWVAGLGPALVVFGGFAMYLLVGLAASGNRR